MRGARRTERGAATAPALGEIKGRRRHSDGPVSAGEVAGKALVPLLAGVVETDDGDVLALGLVLGMDGVQRSDRGGIPDMRLRQVSDDVLGVADVSNW